MAMGDGDRLIGRWAIRPNKSVIFTGPSCASLFSRILLLNCSMKSFAFFQSSISTWVILSNAMQQIYSYRP